MKNTNNIDSSRRDVALQHLYQNSNLKSRNSLGFTLVELIVVITILAILGALAFTQMGGFQGNARDSDRVTTLSQLDSGLELYKIKVGTYPMPEANSSGVVLTGSIDGIVYANLGVIGDSISRNLKMSKTPVDPASLDKYVYATDSTQSYYQIAATLENSISYTNPLTPQAQAATPTQARVNGNYPGYIKFFSGTTTYITNVPSLIWYATGASISLTANPTTTYFVVNKQNNLPYKFNTTDTIQNQNADQIIQSITGYQSAMLTLTGITSLTATGIEAQFTGTLLQSFGGDIAKITTAILGTAVTTGSTLTPINGVCGSANGTPVATAPTTNLCTAGTPTAVAGTGPWTWSCIGTDGGTTASCGASVFISVYSSATIYVSGNSFTYTLPSGSIVTVSVTGPGYGTVAGTKTLHTPACDTDDIAIWQNGTTNVQIWAACNLGASIAVPYESSTGVVTGNTIPDATEITRIGNLYQWHRNDIITTTTTTTSLAPFTDSNIITAGHTNFILGTALYSYNWATFTGSTSDSTWVASPCSIGYHIPSKDGTMTNSSEWGTAYIIANNMTTIGLCTQIEDYNRLRCALMIPFSGYRIGSSGLFSDQGLTSTYWSSSLNTSAGAYGIRFFDNKISTVTAGRTGGNSIRCLKN